ncbi:alpha/beta fold hydrolase [Propylenella binzhouense]|uniref:Alpha/beta hydrolase n=1 Tax=Propylenella binzhouense TaxID=2555902 RepID=A0A964T8V4_9HYPH|nr:alpha/beta hydrolase [Propylenella binzhouense]MYZ50012.1 alpha/beta hydrolase [Propylenella binzhouense]
MATQSFNSDGVPIAYLDEGEGAPVLLIHGFASNHKVNWVATSWVRDLVHAGYRVIAFDNRGHGESGKPHDPEAYGTPNMAEDARRLLDHLGIPRAHVVGYSMGARIAAFLALAHPDRLRAVVLSGLGEGLVKGVGAPGPIAAAMRAPSAETVEDEDARAFRVFADQTGADREALAACITASRQTLTPEELGRIRLPVLVAVGTADTIAGDPAALAALIPGARAFAIPGRDHMKAVGDRAHKKAVIEFLGEHG